LPIGIQRQFTSYHRQTYGNGTQEIRVYIYRMRVALQKLRMSRIEKVIGTRRGKDILVMCI